jgi:hypothetical protein
VPKPTRYYFNRCGKNRKEERPKVPSASNRRPASSPWINPGASAISADFRKNGGEERTTSLFYEKVRVSNQLSQEKRCQYQLMIAKCKQECKKSISTMGFGVR